MSGSENQIWWRTSPQETKYTGPRHASTSSARGWDHVVSRDGHGLRVESRERGGVQNGSHTQGWRAKPQNTSRMSGVTTCPRRNASCKGGSEGGARGTASGNGADNLELEELMVLCGRGVVHDTVKLQ
eukprot:865553-Pleurochrysis_carterae.AAC.5